MTIGGTTAGAGNTISGNSHNGINIGAPCLVEGNFIGTNPAGTAAVPNLGYGILALGSGGTVGGTTADAANIISGNGIDGIDLDASCLIEGNLIGTNASGTAALANGVNGIDVLGPGVTVGGTASDAGNVISGNGTDGIDIQDPSCLVEGNLIGTDSTGTNPIPNNGNGVFLAQGTSGGETIGVTGSGNIIAFNDGPGVATSSGATGGTIRFNSIFENTGPGIDLNDDGVQPNAPEGANNSPVVSSAGGDLISGSLNASPNSTYVIDFYASPSDDASAARPQGHTYLCSATVATNSQGNAAFSVSYTALTTEPFVTATSTDAGGTTSDFSAPVADAVTGIRMTLTATVGVPFEGQVASFTTTDGVATAADFTATIDYGDGSPSSMGTIVAYGGGFVVVGSHTFTQADPAVPITVTITDSLGFSQATANSLAKVSGPSGVLMPFGRRREPGRGESYHRDGSRLYRLEPTSVSGAVQRQHLLGRRHLQHYCRHID